MKAVPFLFVVVTLASCRSTRATVDVMDPQTPTKPANDDFTHVTGSIKTSVKISAVSLPVQKRDYDRLDIVLRVQGTAADYFASKNYILGDSISIAAHQTYEISLGAWMGGTEVYSTRFCVGKQTFLAEDGVNTFTASLCAKP